jgi:hypothetical protein
MIETFRVCRRAYQMAFLKPGAERVSTNALCKRFLIKALGEINRGRIVSINQAQKFLGQHWPADKFNVGVTEDAQNENIQAFRFVYRALTNYVGKPYRPDSASVGAVNLRVRARVPHTRIYLEDSFDLILWYPNQRRLELVDFHLHPLKPMDASWPSATLLTKHFLAERLRTRWPFEKLTITFCQVKAQSLTTTSIDADDGVYLVHWPAMLNTLEQMKDPEDFAPRRSDACKQCHFLEQCLAAGQDSPKEGGDAVAVCRTA